MASDQKKITTGGSKSIPGVFDKGTVTVDSIVVAASNFIAGEESFVATAYRDITQWSIGFGTGISFDMSKRPTMTVTRSQATEMLYTRVRSDLNQLQAKNKKPISNNAIIALLSFGYNLGISRAVLMLDRYNNGQSLDQIAETMLKYFHCSEPDPKRRAELEAGLKKRRAREVNLLLS